ncbi:cellulose biosynthesis cyclic di-GMP-binding regulatory protein BcsB [Paracoccus ravus]|uniref:cellulose biosynthesis cyclic di-GMP-binding regulatory protein BcsB n=1 Tax=Paracoccus ravus TaxID=2447760 RepID=UPI00106EBCF7|nr:cellulose biosynthesis cyclic di-GMP-binding regulatory protein BcsB [Paracoccus ravus]
MTRAARAPALILAVILALGLTTAAASAQDVPEIRIAPPETSETEPEPEPEPRPETTATPVPAERDATEAVTEPQERRSFAPLRPSAPVPPRVVMGAGLSEPGILRLTGEVAASSFDLWLPEDLPLPRELVLTTRASINVLPDNAALRVTVNDAPPAELPVSHFEGFQPLRLPAPGLVPGMNRIGIALDQPHRIFCGPDASFDVWTEFDLARSGAEYPAATLPLDAQAFSRAVGDQIAAGRPLALLADPAADPASLRALATTLGAAMQGLGRIEIRSFYAPGSDGASVALVPSGQSRASLRRDARGAAVLVVEVADGVLPDLKGMILAEAMPASPPVPSLSPGRETSLAELGAPDVIGNTRYYRHDLRFRLPSDWLLLANQKAQMRLVYGFADDLPKGAMLLVKINDETIRLLPLDSEGGRIVDPLAIPFAARLLHPGVNRLSFEMMVPGDPADSACGPRRTDMLVITGDTTLEVPTSPAMSLSGLSGPLLGLTADGISVSPEAAEQDSLQRFATELAARFAGTGDADDQVSLSVTDVTGLSRSESGIPPRILQDALLPPAAASAASIAPGADSPGFRLSEDAPQTDPAKPEPGKGGEMSIANWVSRQAARLRQAAFMSSDGDLATWLAARKGDALLISADPSEPGALRLVLGPQARAEAIGSALISMRDDWLGEGRVALLSNDGTRQVWAEAGLPRMREAVTPLNMLPVLGNYASWSPLLFTAGIMAFALISVIPALLIVIIFRSRRIR